MVTQLTILLTFVLLSATLDADEWQPPEGLPYPPTPVDNPITTAKIFLGRKLFYDAALSLNETISCSSCHLQKRAFTDPAHPSTGAMGEALARNAPSLVNLAWQDSFGWADNTTGSLESQLAGPLFNKHPVELGFDETVVRGRLIKQNYLPLFSRAFPSRADPITTTNIIKAIATFERTLVSVNSSFDNWLFRGVRPSDTVVNGFLLFQSERLQCGECHSGINFGGRFSVNGQSPKTTFHNTGVKSTDLGLATVTRNNTDSGKFSTPSLRNIACTAPYMHNGKLKTLRQVVEHYARGPAPSAGLGGFQLNEQETSELITFLQSLTDEEFLSRPDLAEPGKMTPDSISCSG